AARDDGDRHAGHGARPFLGGARLCAGVGVAGSDPACARPSAEARGGGDRLPLLPLQAAAFLAEAAARRARALRADRARRRLGDLPGIWLNEKGRLVCCAVDLRSLPSVDEVLARPAVRALAERHGRAAAKAGARAAIA